MASIIGLDDLKAEFRKLTKVAADAMSEVDRKDLQGYLDEALAAGVLAAAATDPEEKAKALQEVAKFRGAALYKLGEYQAQSYEAAVRIRAEATKDAVEFGFRLLLYFVGAAI